MPITIGTTVAAVCSEKLEDPRRGDERDAHDVVERRVNLRRGEAHLKLLPGTGIDWTP
jgi:hypothetical protein